MREDRGTDDAEHVHRAGTTTDDPHGVTFFETARPRLLGIAYRILGSHAEAEDAVQDTYLRWQNAEKATMKSPGAWLTTVCTRRAVDMLRSAYRTRVDYVGNWLPEPVQTLTESSDPAEMLELSSSLSTAFLLVLERLAPKERAAYLLREIFDVGYADVAAALDMNEAACRKLVSRANARISRDEVRHPPSWDRQRELLAAFEDAVRTGQPDDLAQLLVSDVRLTADGGGKASTVVDVSHGREVIRILTERFSEWWKPYEWRLAELNGALGLVLRQAGIVVATVSLSYDASGRIDEIYIMRNPDKLSRLHDVRIQ
ncbi:RNA polymerase sigma factor SigJ [Arvimicrobium flavum]|uniref:RNA polymerase sigma factor SigJ n=1 Tax=Arvimicrobium flavum TaxID=3393320 RepID=UPI00237B1081|nr:RNA polymerase sigma factor SigJ [Mesorhizobium shangrilense]